MNRQITFNELRQLLTRLDFSEVTQRTHVRFEHDASGAVVILRPYRSTEIVTPIHLAVVRRTLVEKGLIEAESFERFLQKAPA